MKKTWVRKTLSIGVLAAGALLFGPAAAAQADHWNDGVSQQSVGNFGVANGNQFFVPVTMPVNECGNSTALGGISYAAAACTNAIGVDGRKSVVTKLRKSESLHTSKNLLGDNALGNAAHQMAHGSKGGAAGIGGLGNLGGLGGHNGHGGHVRHVTPNFGHVSPNAGHVSPTWGHAIPTSGHAVPTWGHVSPSFGNVSPGLGQGVPVGGNLGNGGQAVGGDWDDIQQTSVGNFGYLNGNQFVAPVTAPINICGNSLSFLGQSYSQASCSNVIGGKVKTVKPAKPGMDDDGDVAGDNDGYPSKDDDGDVRGDNGYNAADEKPDAMDAGDEMPGAADAGDEMPDAGDEPTGDAMDDKGYGGELPDQYSGDKGGRGGASEKSTINKVAGGDLGGLRSAGLGSLGLFNTLR